MTYLTNDFRQLHVFDVYERESLEELTLNCLAKMTFPKSAPKQLGNLFAPNGMKISSSK